MMHPDAPPITHSAGLVPVVLRRIEAALAGLEGLRWAYLFGSAGRGEPFHDLDLAVAVRRESFAGLREWGRLRRELQRASILPGVQVEVLDLATAPHPMLAEILRDGRLVLDREPGQRREWEVRATMDWLDFQPVWEEQARVRAAARR
jgi:predicted nucleotidyltransferase